MGCSHPLYKNRRRDVFDFENTTFIEGLLQLPFFSLWSLAILKTTVYVTASSQEFCWSLVSSKLDGSMHISHLLLKHRSISIYKSHIPLHSVTFVNQRISRNYSTMAPIIHCVRHAQVKFLSNPVPDSFLSTPTLIILLPGLPQPEHRKPRPSRPPSYSLRRRAMYKSARELSLPQTCGHGCCISPTTNNLHRALRL